MAATQSSLDRYWRYTPEATDILPSPTVSGKDLQNDDLERRAQSVGKIRIFIKSINVRFLDDIDCVSLLLGMLMAQRPGESCSRCCHIRWGKPVRKIRDGDTNEPIRER